MADEDFQAFVGTAREALTKRVMHHATDEQSRARYLAEFHGLNRFIMSMEAAAQQAEEQSE